MRSEHVGFLSDCSISSSSSHSAPRRFTVELVFSGTGVEYWVRRIFVGKYGKKYRRLFQKRTTFNKIICSNYIILQDVAYALNCPDGRKVFLEKTKENAVLSLTDAQGHSIKTLACEF
ncbi:unnamed protein product [Haemonchus placei]|uniref:Uncharacterized protein n=1 Tax=Haemonchus placei TaxID=6290 RepID=A0A0N4WCY5_HAEPC|nr:unnamed protein product [Haemonchus placei]